MADWYARPVVFVTDAGRASAFYVEALGFAEAWRHDEDGVALVVQVEREGCELILSSQWPDKAGTSLNFVSLAPAALEAVRAEFAARGVALEEGWWGYRVLIVADPDGNRLYFPYPAD